MTEFLKKHKLDALIWTGLILAFFATRLINLGLIPIFTDEAIYLRWSQIMAYDAGLRYLPLVDGKPPLFMWLTAIAMRILPTIDPLISGRLVAVGAGFLGLVGTFFAAYVLFNHKKTAYIAAIFYLLCPFTLFYDRFGLADSLLAALGVWSFGLGVLLVRKVRLDIALILGWVIGLGLLTKTPALFFLFFLPILLILFDFKSFDRKTKLIKLLGLFGVVAVESLLIFSVLRLFPLFNMLSQKNTEFVLSFGQFFKNPFQLFWPNVKTLLVWQWSYLTPVISILALVSLTVGVYKKQWEKLVLAAFFLGFLGYMAFFNKSIFPRYLLTFTPLLLILAARVRLAPVLLVLALIWPMYVNFLLLTNPVVAPIPDGDSNQYMNRWPAGYGVVEIRKFLAEESRNNAKVTVGVEGTFGLMPYALQIYQKEYPNVEIKDYWPLPDRVPDPLDYFIIYQQPLVSPLWRLELVAKYQQGNGPDYLRLYRVL